MSPQQAQTLSRLEARAAVLRRAWLASGHKAPAAGPAVISGILLTPNLDVDKAPAAPDISVNFQAAAGLSFISACFTSNTTTQTSCTVYEVPFGLSGPTGGKLRIRQPAGGGGSLNLYAAPGAWSLTDLFLADMSGAVVNYNQSQIPTLFPGGSTINVTNIRTPDTSPPVITAGKVLTPVVSLSSANPGFGVQLTVSDNLSGVGQLCIEVSDPNGGGYLCDATLPPSPRSGKVETAVYIGNSVPTGTWKITYYSVCDVAGNCISDNNPADIQSLFGTTTFTVTN